MKYPCMRLGSEPTHVFAMPGENMIQTAVDAAEEGDKVVVIGDHTLSEPVSVDSGIIISGTNTNIHLDLGDETAFDIDGDAFISNLTMSGTAGTCFDVSGGNTSIVGCCMTLNNQGTAIGISTP